MARSARKHQKKVERKKAKRNDKHRALAKLQPQNVALLLQRYATAPVLDCFVMETLWEEGLAQAMLSRKAPGGNVAFSVFLLDIHCLGVKDAFSNVRSLSEYRELYEGMIGRYEPLPMAPPAFRKLVEGAVAFARDCGLPPHRDYHAAAQLFGDIDASQCTEEFEYGKDGVPSFFAGPYDTPEKCRRIIAALNETYGPNGFHYTLPSTIAGQLSLPGRPHFVALGHDDDDDEAGDYDDAADGEFGEFAGIDNDAGNSDCRNDDE